MHFNHRLIFIAILLSFGTAGCARPKEATKEEKRDYVLRMKNQTLAQLYRENPESKAKIKYAPAFAVFSNVGTGLLILGTGRGYGVVVNNATANKTYMRMAEVAFGLGVQLKDFSLSH